MGDLSGRVVIVGAGHAGGSAAALLRQYGWKGPITLIGAEPVAPYQRPPLSKAWLQDASDLPSLLLRPADFYRSQDVALLLSTHVISIDRRAGTVALASGETIAYDHPILALGASARPLPVPGHDLAGVFRLRTVSDANALKAALHPGARIAIIGAGYIGLEVAASARLLGARRRGDRAGGTRTPTRRVHGSVGILPRAPRLGRGARHAERRGGGV